MEPLSEKLQQDLAKLPRTSGVYFFYAKKELVYIGKAISLRDRAKNHFLQPSYRDTMFIHTVTGIDFIDTGSEIEALILEANLIKKHLPKFNVVWKDDKNYFYVAIAKNKQKLPYIFITHQKENVNTIYIGPFVEGNPLKKTLKFLRKVFPYYTSSKHPKQKCTWCHIELCPGPTPNISEYKKNIKKLSLILQGKRKIVLGALKKEMSEASKINDFERAAKIRDRIFSLENIFSHRHVMENRQLATNNWPQTEERLRELLGMGHSVSKIECYDISNIQGKHAVGSMVVFVDGAPDKNQYRKFRIKMENEPNDIAMLKEVLTRRMHNQKWPYPDVMLIDGGIAQLNVAIKVKGESSQGKRIKVISIAKGRQELFIEDQKTPIPLKELPQEIYNLIKNLDDEAHRFAITYYKKVHKKSLLS